MQTQLSSEQITNITQRILSSTNGINIPELLIVNKTALELSIHPSGRYTSAKCKELITDYLALYKEHINPDDHWSEKQTMENMLST